MGCLAQAGLETIVAAGRTRGGKTLPNGEGLCHRWECRLIEEAKPPAARVFLVKDFQSNDSGYSIPSLR